MSINTEKIEKLSINQLLIIALVIATLIVLWNNKWMISSFIDPE